MLVGCLGSVVSSVVGSSAFLGEGGKKSIFHLRVFMIFMGVFILLLMGFVWGVVVPEIFFRGLFSRRGTRKTQQKGTEENDLFVSTNRKGGTNDL